MIILPEIRTLVEDVREDGRGLAGTPYDELRRLVAEDTIRLRGGPGLAVQFPLAAPSASSPTPHRELRKFPVESVLTLAGQLDPRRVAGAAQELLTTELSQLLWPLAVPIAPGQKERVVVTLERLRVSPDQCGVTTFNELIQCEVCLAGNEEWLAAQLLCGMPPVLALDRRTQVEITAGGRWQPGP